MKQAQSRTEKNRMLLNKPETVINQVPKMMLRTSNKIKRNSLIKNKNRSLKNKKKADRDLIKRLKYKNISKYDKRNMVTIQRIGNLACKKFIIIDFHIVMSQDNY